MTNASLGMEFISWSDFLVWNIFITCMFSEVSHGFIMEARGLEKKGKKEKEFSYLVSHHKSVELTLYSLKGFLISHL